MAASFCGSVLLIASSVWADALLTLADEHLPLAQLKTVHKVGGSFSFHSLATATQC